MHPPSVVQATDLRAPVVDRLVGEVLADGAGSMLSGARGNPSWKQAVQVVIDLHLWGKLFVAGRLTVVMVKLGPRCVLAPEPVVMVRLGVGRVAEPEFVVVLGSDLGGRGGVFGCG